MHRASWPNPSEVAPHAGGDDAVLEVASEVLGAVRREKTVHKRSMRARVSRLMVSGPDAVLAAVEAARGDILDAGGVDQLVTAPGDALNVEVELAEEA